MTISEQIIDIIPNLRRFGRMVSGLELDQVDDLIKCCLQDLSDGVYAVGPRERMAVCLYRQFLSELARRAAEGSPDIAAQLRSSSHIEDQLKALNRAEVEVFLLRHVEGFSVLETAAIMNVSTEDVDRHEADVAKKI